MVNNASVFVTYHIYMHKAIVKVSDFKCLLSCEFLEGSQLDQAKTKNMSVQ